MVFVVGAVLSCWFAYLALVSMLVLLFLVSVFMLLLMSLHLLSCYWCLSVIALGGKRSCWCFCISVGSLDHFWLCQAHLLVTISPLLVFIVRIIPNQMDLIKLSCFQFHDSSVIMLPSLSSPWCSYACASGIYYIYMYFLMSISMLLLDAVFRVEASSHMGWVISQHAYRCLTRSCAQISNSKPLFIVWSSRSGHRVHRMWLLD